jgi:hypothetical protein
MCKKTHKCMFASSLGYSMHIFFCATAMHEMFVVNNKEKGGPISQLEKINYNFSKYKDNAFLDSLTGDYYIYN